MSELIIVCEEETHFGIYTDADEILFDNKNLISLEEIFEIWSEIDDPSYTSLGASDDDECQELFDYVPLMPEAMIEYWELAE